MSLISTAYAGTADINEDNVAALLGQILPDGPLGMVFIPEKTIVKRNQPGLYKVVNWLQHSEDGVGEEGTIPVPNLVEALLGRNTKLAADGEDEDELILVMAYDPASGLDASLAKEAHDAGIRVINLAAAGDDLTFDEPDPEPPAEDTPPFEPDEPTDPTPAPEPPKESPAQRVRKAREAGTTAARRTRAPEPTAESPLAAEQAAADKRSAALAGIPASGGVQFNLTITVPAEGVATFAAAIVAAMGVQAQAVVEAPAPLPSNVTPIGSAGGNAADPAGQPEGTAVYYYNEDKGTYRPARGTKRAGETRVFLTPDEVAEAKSKNMLG